jgi:hypothetical protein
MYEVLSLISGSPIKMVFTPDLREALNAFADYVEDALPEEEVQFNVLPKEMDDGEFLLLFKHGALMRHDF